MTPPATVDLKPIGRDDWRDCTRLEVTEAQQRFVASPAYYLALCCYDDSGWTPLGIHAGGTLIGFAMWTVDPADGSCWLGGILIDRRRQGQGYGRRAVLALLETLHRDHGFSAFALSYEPENLVARNLYRGLGFRETGEREGEEVVARRSYPV